MKASRRAPPRPPGRSHAGAAPAGELADLRGRLAETEDALRAIRNGEVDAVVVAGKTGPQVFTLQGAEHAYRVLIESMNEGALTLTADKVILYANERFAHMVKYPLEQVVGSSIRRFLSAEDRTTLQPLLQRTDQSGGKLQVWLKAGDGSLLPAQISLRRLARKGLNRAILGMVVTDMTEARRSEDMLRALSHRLVQAQETERGGVALELHDHITQLLCAILFRSQALADKLSTRDGPSKRDAMKLREMVGQAAEAVERISHNLRPSVLDQLGLVAALRGSSTEFAARTGVSVKLACVQLATRLPADAETALYRILQQALKNVEEHARARHVAVELDLQRAFVRLTIKDDGVGFDPERRRVGRKAKGSVGLLGMRERAAYLGGILRLRSAPRRGTEIDVRIPVPPPAAPRPAAVQPKARRSSPRDPTSSTGRPVTR